MAIIPADKELYQRQIEATDAEIDALVYELYGLTEEEIAIVEGRDPWKSFQRCWGPGGLIHWSDRGRRGPYSPNRDSKRNPWSVPACGRKPFRRD